MTTQPIPLRCTCCERTDTADIPAADFDALAELLGQAEPTVTPEA